MIWGNEESRVIGRREYKRLELSECNVKFFFVRFNRCVYFCFAMNINLELAVLYELLRFCILNVDKIPMINV